MSGLTAGDAERDEGKGRTPLRIELATSEIPGGSCRAWADPSQVLALVAVSRPEDVFRRHLEGPLEAMGREFLCREPGRAEAGEGKRLPRGLEDLVERLQDVHQLLYAGNRRDPAAPPSSLEVAGAFGDDDRVLLVKTAPSWICVIRGGRAHLVETFAEGESVGLGATERLRLEVTSVNIRPEDTVVVLASEARIPPDLPAVESLFAQTADLKRACDGLVDLIGLQSRGASGIAIRFLPLLSAPRSVPSVNPLLGLSLPISELPAPPPSPPAPEPVAQAGWEREADALRAGAFEHPPADAPRAGIAQPVRPADAPDRSPGSSDPPLAAPENPGPPLPPRPVPEPTVPLGAATSSPSPQPTPVPPVSFRTRDSGPVASSTTMEGSDGFGETHTSGSTVPNPTESPAESDPDDRTGLRRWMAEPSGSTMAVVACALVAVAVGLLIAVPGFQRPEWLGEILPWGGGDGSAAAVSELQVQPDPPANAVLIDGEVVAGPTPVVIHTSPGRHEIALDYGPCGLWRRQIEARCGRPGLIEPRLSGSVRVQSPQMGDETRVWVQGRSKRSLPAVLDSLPIGWTELFFESPACPLWQRRVLVTLEVPSEVTAPALAPQRDHGWLLVESLREGEAGRGLSESLGDSVFVDGSFSGLTPLQLLPAEGLHGVRVSRDGAEYRGILDVRSGSVRHLLATLQPGEGVRFRHVPPGRIRVNGPILLSVELEGTDPENPPRPLLHVPGANSGYRQIQMSPVDSEGAGFVGIVDPSAIEMGRPIPYYFTVENSGGDMANGGGGRIPSELYWFTAQRRRATPAQPPSLPDLP